jgi:hypothetical protein
VRAQNGPRIGVESIDVAGQLCRPTALPNVERRIGEANLGPDEGGRDENEKQSEDRRAGPARRDARDRLSFVRVARF